MRDSKCLNLDIDTKIMEGTLFIENKICLNSFIQNTVLDLLSLSQENCQLVFIDPKSYAKKHGFFIYYMMECIFYLTGLTSKILNIDNGMIVFMFYLTYPINKKYIPLDEISVNYSFYNDCTLKSWSVTFEIINGKFSFQIARPYTQKTLLYI